MYMKKAGFSEELIAPCGMNCGICIGFLREKNKCPGCRGTDINKSITRSGCRIKNCNELKENNLKFCIKCKIYSCQRMKQLDKRYRTKYNMSMFENLEYIRDKGIGNFLKKQEGKYQCPDCGGVICVHDRKCYSCNTIIQD